MPSQYGVMTGRMYRPDYVSIINRLRPSLRDWYADRYEKQQTEKEFALKEKALDLSKEGLDLQKKKINLQKQGEKQAMGLQVGGLGMKLLDKTGDLSFGKLYSDIRTALPTSVSGSLPAVSPTSPLNAIGLGNTLIPGMFGFGASQLVGSRKKSKNVAAGVGAGLLGGLLGGGGGSSLINAGLGGLFGGLGGLF